MDRILHFLGKDKQRAYQVVVATLPLTIYLTYSLYHRIVFDQKPEPFPLPTIVKKDKNVKSEGDEIGK